MCSKNYLSEDGNIRYAGKSQAIKPITQMWMS